VAARATSHDVTYALSSLRVATGQPAASIRAFTRRSRALIAT